MKKETSIHSKRLKGRVFTPLDLINNDHLIRDIELVLGFDYQIDPEALEMVLDKSLEAFPHLTGQLKFSPVLKIEPSDHEVRFDCAEIDHSVSAAELEKLSLSEHRNRFLPVSANQSKSALFGIKLTQARNRFSILGIRASHAAVDGTGLALFLHHCTYAMRDLSPFPVIHGRAASKGTINCTTLEIPRGYAAAKQNDHHSDLIAENPSVIFTIAIDTASQIFGGKSLIDTRLRLSAWLCAEIASIQPSYKELAVWCDPRGLNNIPQTYTGNSGCYINFSMEGIDANELTDHIRSLATKRGFERISNTHQQIQLAEQLLQPIEWVGLNEQIIQLNLVPHAAESANFGSGAPVFGLMLSRNSSGLRISITPDGSRYLIEACFEDAISERLYDACTRHHLSPKLWCTGSISPEIPC